MNYMDQENDDETFKDQPDEVAGEEAAHVNVRVQRQLVPTQPAEVQHDVGLSPGSNTTVEQELGEEEDDFSEVLNDASLRLEQGQLYKLIMNTDLFNEGDADAKAIRNVQREIKAFARERMEVMLGMRQEPSKEQVNAFPMDMFPFNALEVEVLKSLAATATKGQTANAEPYAAPKQVTLNKVSVQRPTRNVQPSKPLPQRASQPVKRTARQQEIEKILQEEGVTLDEINEVFDPNKKYFKDRKEFAELTSEQIIDRNKKLNAGKPVPNPQALPMPPQEQIDNMYAMRATQAAANPQMQMIMTLLEKKKTT